MSICKIYVDDQIFYHPHIEALSVLSAEVTENAQSIDSLKLSVSSDHPYLDSIKPLSSIISVFKDEMEVFRGRALDDGIDFYNSHVWNCESALAFLKDSILKPFDYQGPLKNMLQQFIDEHNQQTEKKKQFRLGDVTVKDNNDYIHYSSETFIQTMDAIKEKLMDTHGGYLRYRCVDGENILDYLEDFSEVSMQSVEYGKNLLDVQITQDHASRASALIPFGAVIEEADKPGQADQKLDITAVNNGVNYVFDQNAVDEIGWIWTSEVWDNVTEAANLLRKAKQRLNELKDGITSIELSIIDESDTGADINDIHAREYVRCYSPAHGIDGQYLVMEKTVDYINPASNKITIGAKGVTLSRSLSGQSSQGPKGDPGISGEDGVVLKIHSSKGLIFKNSSISTILSAVVFYGPHEIRDIDALHQYFSDTSRLQWQFENEETGEVNLVDDSDGRIGKNGFTFSISPSDVQDKATITCSLIL